MTISRTAKLVFTVTLFAVGLALVGMASAVKNTAPLFVAWIPLLTVPWILTRPEEPTTPAEGEPPGVESAEASSQPDSGGQPQSDGSGQGDQPNQA